MGLGLGWKLLHAAHGIGIVGLLVFMRAALRNC